MGLDSRARLAFILSVFCRNYSVRSGAKKKSTEGQDPRSSFFFAPALRKACFCRILTLCLVLSVYGVDKQVVQAVQAVPSRASSANDAVVSALEKKLFMQSFDGEEMSSRLSRLEQRVFGKVMPGTTEERLARLQQTAETGPDAIFSAPTQDTQQPAASTSSPPVTVQQPTSVQESPPSSVPGSVSGSHVTAKENERLRVQKAEEQEIYSLLAEGVTAWRQHNAQMALDQFQQVARLDPRNAQAYFSLGIIYETQGDFQKALDNYKDAYQIRPDNKDYRDAVAQAQKKLDLKQQVDAKQAGLSKLSQDALAAYNRGEYLSALDLYKQIDAKFPDQAINKYNIGSVYLVLRQPEMALEYYKQAKRLKPDDQKFSQALDSLQTALKNQAGANASNSSQGYTMPAGPSKNSRRNRFREQHNQTASPAPAHGFIVNYGLEVKGGGKGIRVKSVLPSSRAAAAGMQSGDCIKAINGMVVDTTDGMDRILSGCNPNRQLQLTVQRGMRMLQVVL